MGEAAPTWAPEHPLRLLKSLVSTDLEGDPQPGQGRLVIPVTIRSVDGVAPADRDRPSLQSASETGLVLSSRAPFGIGQILAIELCVNNTVWQDKLRVCRCESSGAGYHITLESPATPASTPRRDDGNDPTRKFQRLVRERAWLAQAKEDIKKATGAYLLARRSLGLLGGSVRKQISKAVAAMPGAPSAGNSDERRRHERRHTGGDTYIVLHSVKQWRLIAAQIVDVSEGGLRMAVPSRGDAASEGGEELANGTAVVVGLGAEPSTLWVPAEVVRVEPDRGGVRHIGLQFITPKSLEALG